MFNLEDYETVEERLIKFWKDHPNGRVETKLIAHTPTQYIVWSAIYRDAADMHPWATGLAEETVQGRGVNSTSACENAETSSLGRSLANAGYATKGKRASRSEMAKVAAVMKTESIIDETKKKLHRLNLAYMEETMRRKINYFYVDEVKYSDGTTYQAERFTKPLRTLNKY